MNQTLRLILIDDNPDDRLLAIRQLQREFSDLNIEQIIDPESLNRALEAGNFDLAITDYQLQWSNGLVVLRELKARYPHCPAIMFTNTGSEEIAVEAMKAGLDDYIIKSPKHYIRLARAVSSVLERVWQRQALKEAESRYRRLFEQVPVGLYRTSADGQIIDANPAMVQMLGYPSKQSLLAVKLVDLYADVGERSSWQTRIEQEAVVPNFEMQVRQHDGKIIWVIHSARAIRDSKTQLLSYEGALEDITERKQTEKELAELLKREQSARAQAEAANRIKDEFLGTLSHELRTPLNSILGWARMLRSRNFDEKVTARALETIERNAEAQTKLVENLLDISRLIRGQMAIAVRPVDLVKIVATAIDTMRPALDAKGIDIDSTLDPAASAYVGDPDRLQQIIWNLLSNAIKFTPAGGRVEVRLERTDTSVQIQVSDTGIGIPAEFLPYTFDRFRQADSSTTRAHGGLGLGLALVRQLVELHGGTVTAQSPGEGKGATLTVQLPLPAEYRGAEEQANQGEFSPSDKVTESQSFPLKGLRVLVVDDDADSREFIATVLEEYSAEVMSVASVKEALDAIDRHRPDVLVSDIGMPGEDGYSLIRQLRQQEAESGKNMPAVALTAYASESDEQQALAAGFQMHLPKPVAPDDLAEAVAKLCGRRGKV